MSSYNKWKTPAIPPDRPLHRSLPLTGRVGFVICSGPKTAGANLPIGLDCTQPRGKQQGASHPIFESLRSGPEYSDHRKAN